VLTAAGAHVTREFYINDRGNQMDLFGQSVEAVALGQSVPENGYQGDYIKDLAIEVVKDNPGIKELAPQERTQTFREAAY
jgi:arginyl-tRNA synthetase